MQARTVWSPPGGALGRLTARATERVAPLKARRTELRRIALAAPPVASLARAILSQPDVAVVAEIKRRSPSRGNLNETLDVAVRAREYANGGARGLSVLTEPDEFGGSLDDLITVARAVQQPVLKKDFHVDPVQAWEARALGASAMLLIVRALGPDGTRRMADAAREAAIESLFEVRDEWELDWALEAGAELCGVNQRNLETLEMEEHVSTAILPRIPAHCASIAESGIVDPSDVERWASLGADAVLIGSSLSVAANATEAVARLVNVPRRARS